MSAQGLLKKVAVNVVRGSFVAAVFAGLATSAVAQTAYIRTRPLTPQEIKNAGLTNTTQLANGNRNVGQGTPLYLEALVTKSGTVVTNVTWSFINRPTNSAATFMASPLLTNTVGGITNVLSFDVGDRNTYLIAGRSLLVPDIACSPAPNGDFVIQVQVDLTTKTIYATNTCYGSLFIGCANVPFGPNGEGLCYLCHNAPYVGSKMDAWGKTAHATAFTRKINGEAGAGFKSTCASCHVVGYDKTLTATNGGFDDIMMQTGWTWPTNLATAGATNNWSLMPQALQNKANIQCESCHGPADRHARNLGDPAAIGISVSAGNCGFCHDSLTHHTKNYEWNQSIHGSGTATYRPYSYYTNYPTVYSTNYLGNVVTNKNSGGVLNPRFYNNCGHCHSAQGFILDVDPDWVGVTNSMAFGTGYEGLTCAACHDPHEVGMGDYQLRPFTNVVLANYYTNTLGGASLLCMQCHHDRVNAYELDMIKGTNNPATAPKPHHGTQGDMLIGANAIEYGLQMPKSRHINVLEEGCIECHMAETPTNGLAMNHMGGHTFSLSYTTNSVTYEQTETCVKCHGEIEGFNFGGIDYDHDGVVEGVQAEIQGLLDSVAKLLPYGTPPVYGTTNKPSPAVTWTLAQKKAAYNYLFVWEDRSLGVHNPKYAAAILQASIDDLKGGIDVDRDGLLDSWEIQYFGNITSQDGSGDLDGDGVSNAREQAAGTIPIMLYNGKFGYDSDGDGVWDGVELSAGSDPLKSTSKPGTNSVSILPAIELGYVPDTNGVTMYFQSLTDLGLTSGWTNIGSFVSTNATMSYQLQTLRGQSNRFYRVVTP